MLVRMDESDEKDVTLEYILLVGEAMCREENG